MDVVTEIQPPQPSDNDFIVESYGTGKSLKSTARRYLPPGSNGVLSPERPGYILIFAHGTGFHKEHWEPSIQRMVELSSNSSVHILESWAIDAQTHGAAAKLNERVIHDGSWTYRGEDYGETCANLYKDLIAPRRLKGVHKVVLIGHSAGSQAAVHATTFLNCQDTFDIIVLVEPPIWPKELHNVADTPVYKAAVQRIPHRRAVWKDQTEARQYFGSRAPWNRWDERLLDIYTSEGLKPLPGGGVTLACHPKHEAGPFVTPLSAVLAIPSLDAAAQTIPIHVVFGDIPDMFARVKQDALLKDRTFASVTRVPDVGHMIVQEAPDELAYALFSILHHDRNSRM